MSRLETICTNLLTDRASWANEEEVRHGWLKHFENELNIRFNKERDYNDASYNQVIFEFKGPNMFRGRSESPAFQEAIFDQLGKYIRRKSLNEGIAPEEYIGIATDGYHICFAFLKEQVMNPRNLLPVDLMSVTLTIQALDTARRRAFTAENLLEDFGHSSPVSRILMHGLGHELQACLIDQKHNRVKMLFEEWRALFGQVADLSAAQSKDILKQVPISVALPPKDALAGILYVIHTYHALVMKLLAAEILTEFDFTSHKDFCEYLLGQTDASLLETLQLEVEQGEFFAAARIKGFVEEAVFSWYADHRLTPKGQSQICVGIRALLAKLAHFRMDDLDEARTQDILKSFYSALVPETLRKALGEFYTPAWLVDVACDRAEITNWQDVRVLDPTCGSGSFLLEVIRRKRDAARAQGCTARQVLGQLLDTVWGFDLNPLAVQASRVNFLIAIADLLKDTEAEIELPVLLADAVYFPAQVPGESENTVTHHFGSETSSLTVTLPLTLALDRERLDQVFDVMTRAVEDHKAYCWVAELLVDKGALSLDESDVWAKTLGDTYNQILDLHQRDWNGIWFRIVRNFFWSAAAGEFDLVVGNPPWVRWSNLPERYRERIKETCRRYAIFSDTPFHGGNELDISGMLTYTVADKWLKLEGTMVFLLTQTHFQSGSSQGFRRFQINESSNLVPITVDDLKKLKPFAKAANKTAIVRLKKVPVPQSVIYPIAYNVWNKAPGYGATIPEDITKEDAYGRVQVHVQEAHPVTSPDSPWAVFPPGRFPLMQSLRGRSKWLNGRKGVTTDLNGVYMVRIVKVNDYDGLVQVETRPEAGKTNIGPSRRFWIEPDWLFPLLKGAGDFTACCLERAQELYIIVPNTGIKVASYKEAERQLESLPLTRSYFQHFESQLVKRSTYRKRQSSAPFYAIYNVGKYSFAPYKVSWAEQSATFKSVVVEATEVPIRGSQPYVPDHKVYFVPFRDKQSAYFVCGLLNCQLVREYVGSHTIQIQVSNIFQHLHLPPFDPGNSAHVDLARTCFDAHVESDLDRRLELLDLLSARAEGILV